MVVINSSATVGNLDQPTKILVVNQYYDPGIAASGQLFAELCQSLTTKNVEVTVVTGQPSYTESEEVAAELETDDFGIEIHRVSLGSTRGRSSLRRRLAGYLKFMWKAYKITGPLIRSQKPDVVIMMSNPPLVTLLGSYMAMRWKIPYVAIIHDIYPEAIVESGRLRLPPPIVWFWNKLNLWIYSKASKLVVLSDLMRETLVIKGIPSQKIAVIPNWARPALDVSGSDSELRADFGVGPDELLLLYSGNFGIIHNLKIVVEAAKMLTDKPVKFVFVGGGEQEGNLKSEVRRLGIENVSFHSYLPEEKYSALISSSDACFVGLKPGMERYSEPSKIYSILSAGVPVITLMNDGATQAQMVTQANAGWNATDAVSLVKCIEQLIGASDGEINAMRRESRTLYDENFTLASVVDSYLDCLRVAMHR
jgi:glycosyltransferase involved in cell wall biosynthesis